MTEVSDTGVSDGMLVTGTVDEAGEVEDTGTVDGAGGVEDTGTAVLAA